MSKPTVLVADDDSDISQALTFRLRRLGVAVLRSPDASHALVGTLRSRPDLVVLDINMPNGNGLAVCEMMADSEQCRDIPVIIHSGEADPSIGPRCAQLGARFIRKAPGSTEQIVEIVRETLKITEKRTPQSAAPEADGAICVESSINDQHQSQPHAASFAQSEERRAGESLQPKAITLTGEILRPPVDARTKSSEPDREELFEDSEDDLIGLARPIVLSIDDDDDVRRSLATSLQRRGISVLTASTGKEGIELAEKYGPDAIITDLVLPEAEGAFIVRTIRSSPALAHIPILVLTGQSYPAIRHQILSMGVESFLTKPVSISDVLRELQLCIELPTPTSAQSMATAQ